MAWLGLSWLAYIAGLVLSIYGINQVFEALNLLFATSLWGVLQNAFNVIIAFFGVWQFLIGILVIVMRRHVLVSGRVLDGLADW